MHIMFVVTVSVGKVTMRGHLLMLTWTPLHLGICHFDCFMSEFSGYCCAAMCWDTALHSKCCYFGNKQGFINPKPCVVIHNDAEYVDYLITNCVNKKA